jgi:ComF family protein
LLDPILNVLFPVDCVLCGRRAPERAAGPLCRECVSGFRAPGGPVCARCGSLVPAPGDPCGDCALGQTAYDFGRHALLFDPPLREAIHHFKYNNRFSLARPFARALEDCLRQPGFTATVVVPVPLEPRRERERGYNQAALLARRLGLEVRTDLVRRVRATGTQTGLGGRERRANVRNAFACPRPVGGTVLLVDDVMTTGATVNEVARMLRRSGARRIEVATLTRVGLVDDLIRS